MRERILSSLSDRGRCDLIAIGGIRVSGARSAWVLTMSRDCSRLSSVRRPSPNAPSGLHFSSKLASGLFHASTSQLGRTFVRFVLNTRGLVSVGRHFNARIENVPRSNLKLLLNCSDGNIRVCYVRQAFN